MKILIVIIATFFTRTKQPHEILMRFSWDPHEVLTEVIMRSSLRSSLRFSWGPQWWPHEVSSCGYESSDIFSRTTRLFWKNEHEISSVCTKFGLIEWISLMKNRHFYIKHEILTVTGWLCVVLRIHFTVPFNVIKFTFWGHKFHRSESIAILLSETTILEW